MAVVTSRTVKLLFLITAIITILFPGYTFGEGYEITYDDPSYDVEDMLGDSVSGYEHIDITKISSYESNFGTHLVLEMTVLGLITDSEDIYYSFSLMDAGEVVYYISYCNGDCTGHDYHDGSSNVLQASGANSETLEVRIQISEVEDISEYDFYGETMEYDETNNVYQMDRAPDLDDDWFDDDDWYYGVPIMITKPRPGSTVYGTRMIEGITEYWACEIVSVEVQLDSTSSGGWKKASSTDSWDTWQYDWDTTSSSLGEHTINARAYDGSEYHFDSITVYVDQSAKLSPRETDIPKLFVGTVLEYEITFSDDMYSYFEDTQIDAEMTMTVIDIDTVEVDSKEYEAYTVEMSMSLTMIMVFDSETMTMEVEMEGTQWLRVSDLANIKMDMETVMSYSYFGMSGTETQKATSTWNPALDSYNFPICIGECWEAISTVTTNTETSGSIYGDSSDTDVSETNQEYEALHIEDVTVPTGTYETFVIWSKGSSDSTYGGASSLFTSGSGYTLTYYSPDLGFPVKTESYDNNRDMQVTMELASYKAGHGQGPAGISSGWEFPICYLLVLLVLIVILASVMAVRRRRMEKAEPSSTQYAGIQKGIPDHLSQRAVYAPMAYPVGPVQYTPWAYPSQPPSYVPPAVQQPAYYGQPRQALTAQPYHYLYPVNVAQPLSQQSRQTIGYQPQIRQPVSPMVEVECPNCTWAFSVPLKSAKVQCPFCKITGRME